MMFVLGLIAGTFIGIVTMALMAVAGRDDYDE